MDHGHREDPGRGTSADDDEAGDDDVVLPADEGVDAELGDDPGSGAD